MNAITPISPDNETSFFQTLREGIFGPARSYSDRSSQSSPEQARLDPRKRKLEDVARFVLDHDLDVNAYTLAAAADYSTGADPKFARMIDHHVIEGGAVTQDWLESTRSDCCDENGLGQLEELIRRLEENLGQFGATAHAARSATRDYNCALAEHGRELERSASPGGNVTELVALVKGMIERTHKVEQELGKSEETSLSMRKNLEKAQKMAEEDYLTGLPNRRAFEKLFKAELISAQASGASLALAFCDVDHFKKVNDTHGHDVGDRVLRNVAMRLSAISGEACHVARHGGEEFVILFRGKTPQEAGAILDRAREDMARRNMINRKTRQPIGQITFSAGVAAVNLEKGSRSALRAADEALYQAKEQGRNRILVSGE